MVSRGVAALKGFVDNRNVSHTLKVGNLVVVKKIAPLRFSVKLFSKDVRELFPVPRIVIGFLNTADPQALEIFCKVISVDDQLTVHPVQDVKV